jgi:hypothetical protein
MKSQEIKKLLEKYYNGETTLQEERLLKEYFTGGDVPEEYQAEKIQFDYLLFSGKNNLKDETFDGRVMRKLEGGDNLIVRIMQRRSWFYATAGMAATILILLAIFIRFEPMQQKLQDTYSDPQTAYNEAKKVLFFVSKQFNKGADKLQPIGAYTDGVKELENIKALDKGITAAGKLKKYNKIEQIITENN